MAEQDRDLTAETQPQHLVPIPDGCVVTSVVEVVEYLDEDGDRSYAYRFTGSTSVANVLGLLDLAKRGVIKHSDLDD